ncbi:MAG: hypothetical protein ACFFCM_15100, partial [Promethearchaeota archaeon]
YSYHALVYLLELISSIYFLDLRFNIRNAAFIVNYFSHLPLGVIAISIAIIFFRNYAINDFIDTN